MADVVPGFAGKVLRVDMTREEVSEESYDAATLRAYLGGAGLGARVLYDEVPPGVEWSDPENRLVVASGPLGGTTIGGSGTISISAKGALTNGATTTQANGFFGAYLKFCGYDGIIVTGAAKRWLYLHIHNDGAELRDASKLLGMDTWETDEAIKGELGRRERAMSVFSIGPAGENLVKFAAICGDKGHVAGHNGVGAVMGSKRLKAIAVDRGRRRVPVVDGRRLAEVSRQLLDTIRGGAPSGMDIYNYGTLQGVIRANAGGWLPVKNYTTNVYPITPQELEGYSAENIRGSFQPKKNPCWACQLHHCHIMRITEGPYKGEVVEEPEYEGFAAWGPVTGQTRVAETMVISNDVDRLGFDTNECGWLIGMVMECFEKGILTLEDTDGLEMYWGNADATRAMLRRIAHRQGFGDILAEGVMRAAQRLGVPEMAIHTMKGNSPRGHDHRALWYELFDTCVSNTGTIETSRGADRPQFGLPGNDAPFDPADVVAVAARTKGSMQFEDSLGVCRFNTRTNMPLLLEATRAATGWDFSFDEAMQVGRRTVNLLRAFNLRSGIGPDKDRPSPRYASTPVDGPAQGVSILPHWDGMLRDYYTQMGWDPVTSAPTRETLESLGLEGVAADLGR